MAQTEGISYTHNTMRHAFTMIELIFAIVIIGISIMALPTILLNDASSQEQTLKEEGVMLTTTKISQVLTYPWDENSSPLGTLMSTSQVLNTASGDGELARAFTDFRLGHFPDELRRRMTPASNPGIALAIGGTAGSNIGAFNGTIETIGGAADGNMTVGYKKRYQTTTTVSYVSDATDYTQNDIVFNFSDTPGAVTAAGATNIKMVQVTTDERDAADTAWIPIVRMSAYSTNIGEAEFAKRRY